MKTIKLFLAGLCTFALLTINTLGQPITKTENFDTPDSARTNGWVELGSRANNMDYGYSAGTAFAAGVGAGEAGGKVGRDQIRSMYADVFGSFLTLDTPLTATGRLAVAFQNGNASVIIGHSDSTLVGQNQDSRSTIGIRTVPSARQLEAVIGLTNAVRSVLVVNGSLDVTGLTNYVWQYSWDPSGGTSSTGALTVVVSDDFGGLSSFTNTVTLSLSVADRNQNPRFDSFGMSTRTLSASAVFAQTYIDDVEYTALRACVRIAPASVIAVPGQSNKSIAVTIPAAANFVNDVHITVSSLTPAIAEPLGAAAGTLTLTFPAGGDTTQTFQVNGLSAGETMLDFASTNAICFAVNQVTVRIAATATTLVKTETFNTSSSARVNGWSELGSRANGQSFGFSATANAGGPAGEAGGDFKRDPTRASYADVFGGKLTLNDAVHASGTVIMPTTPGTNAGPIIGHSDSTKIGQGTEANHLGLEGVYTTGGIPEFRARLVLANGTGYEPTGLLSPAEVGTLYYWDYTYDPMGGAEGNGTLTVNISDGVSFFTNTLVVSLTASDRNIGAEFDSFGLSSRSLSAAPAGTPAFVDNVAYTAVAGTPCVRFIGETALVAVAGQTNKVVTVAIPAAASAGGSFNVTVQSLDPTVAVPAGANGSGALALNFPADGALSQSFAFNSLSAGSASFTLSHDGAFCTSDPITVTVLPTASTQLKTETFDSAAAAAANGWVELGSRINGQDFGFSDTINAGGPAGEAGGTFKRDSIRSSYVDVYGGKLTLNDFFSASGELIIPGPHSGNLGPIIGHSDSTRAGQNRDTSGQVVEANNAGLTTVNGSTFYLIFILADGTRPAELAIPGTIATDTVYDWVYAYSPVGGPSGNGSFTVNVSAGGVTNSAVFNLTAAHRVIGAEFDSFGVTSRALPSSTATGPAFVDNVSYSVPSNPLRIAEIEVVGDNLRLTVDTPATGGSHVVRETTALGAAFKPLAGVAFSVIGNQVVAEFPKPDSTRFYQVIIP